MISRRQFRVWLGAVALALFSAGFAYAGAPQPSAQPAAPNVRPLPIPRVPPRPLAKQNQDHLAQWMERHSNLTLAEQLHALDNEPGFREYPPQTQQRMRDQLVRLNNMTPEQRSRLLEGNEALERMTMAQRQQFNASVAQYRALPPDRKRFVAKAFRDLRELPPAERESIVNSERFRQQFTDSERETIRKLLVWEPYFSKGQNPGP